MARVALVTGGTRGIGEAISVALKEAGASVAANYGGNDERAKEFSDRTGIKAYKFDVGDFEAVKAGIAQIEAAGVSPSLVRIAVGLEHPEDLARDFVQALAG